MFEKTNVFEKTKNILMFEKTKNILMFEEDEEYLNV